MNENEFHVPQNSNNPDGQPHYPMNQKYSPHAGKSQITQQGSAPISPPPSTVPRQRSGLFNVDPGALRGCLYRDTYIHLVNRTSFWFHPTYIDYTTTSGFKWNGYAWIPWGTDLDRITSFQCT